MVTMTAIYPLHEHAPTEGYICISSILSIDGRSATMEEKLPSIRIIAYAHGYWRFRQQIVGVAKIF